MAVANSGIWETMAEALAKVDRDIILVILASSKRESLLDMGKRHGIRIAFEAFPDRAYNKDGSLVSRREKGAVIHDHEIVAKRGLKMALEGKVVALDGTEIELKADTLCVHGDNPAAVDMVKRIRQELKDAGVVVTAMKQFV
jgi:UPF0271 protein